MALPIKYRDVAYREKPFWDRVEKSRGCWYLSGRNTGYYVQFSANNRNWPAHRIAYALANEGCPDLLICHKCDNKSCVRPSHLFAGTQQDNVDDMMRKGRHGCHQPNYVHWTTRIRLGMPRRKQQDVLLAK